MDTRIQDYLRYASSRGRETVQIGPFQATFNTHSDNPYLNYGIPDDGAVPTPGEVQAFIQAYEQHARKPRLEYIPKIAPAVEAALLDAGFQVEYRTPLMVYETGSQQPMPTPPNIKLVIPSTDDDYRGMLTAQNDAYGEGPPSVEETARFRDSVESGTIAVLARVESTGEAVGGGICTAPRGGLTELAAVGVITAFRRRGIAGALSRRLVEEALKHGATLPFLMAEGEAEARIYARAGFTRISEILHISRPL